MREISCVRVETRCNSGSEAHKLRNSVLSRRLFVLSKDALGALTRSRVVQACLPVGASISVRPAPVPPLKFRASSPIPTI